ncbi:MAG: PaaI family thioesterase [Xanthobacteraceae bacterium]
MSQQKSSANFLDIISGRAAPPASARLLGWRFVGLDEKTGVLSCTFEATDAHLNPAGLVQGGILAAMLDEAMGPVASALSGGSILAQTLEMKVSCLSAGRVGPIHAEGRIVKRGREILFLEGRLFDGEGRTIATASATARAVTLAK